MSASYQKPRPLPQGDNPSRKRLFRSDQEKLLAGVAGGLAEYFNMDPSLMRLLWVLAALATGGMIFWLYLALWLFLPVGDNTRGQVADPAIRLSESALGLLAWGLVALGVLWILANFGILPTLLHSLRGVLHVIGLVFWPLLLIAAGWLILNRLGYMQGLSEKVPTSDAVKASMEEGYRSMREKTPLKRSKDDRMLLGVCAGIAHWLHIDPAIVRILWVLFSLGGMGTGVILYVLLALIMPEEDDGGAIETVEGEIVDAPDMTESISRAS